MMRMAFVVVCLVVVSAIAWGQGLNASWLGAPGSTPRLLGMGGLGVGTGKGAVAWLVDPAEVAWENSEEDDYYDFFDEPDDDFDEDTGYAWEYSKEAWWAEQSGFETFNTFAGSIAAYSPSHSWGWGAGWSNTTNSDSYNLFGAGLGSRIAKSQFSWGLNAVDEAPSHGSNYLYFNGGLHWQAHDPRLRMDLLIGDLTNQTKDGPYLSFGVSGMPIPRLIVGLDVLDLGSRTFAGPYVNVGAEYALGKNYQWKFRAGALDTGDRHDLTLGVGYKFKKWKVDAGFEDGRIGDTWSVGLTHEFH